MGTKKKTASQIRWQKRKDEVNKKRRDKRAKVAALRVLSAGKVAEAFQSPAAVLNEKRTIKSLAREAYAAGEKIEVTTSPLDPAEIEARAFIVTGRKKDGVKNVKDRIMAIRREGFERGLARARNGIEARLRGTIEQSNIRVIEAFLARMQLMESASSTGLPDAVILSGYEVARIIDALRAAGYNGRSRYRNVRGDSGGDAVIGKAHSQEEDASILFNKA